MFSNIFSDELTKKQVSSCLLTSKNDVQNCLKKTILTTQDLPTLLSPAAEPFLEQLAQRSYSITRQRHGNIMQLFIPMYLSNECFNTCTYCGFSMNYDYPRKTLTNEEIIKEAKLLSKKGFKHILLLTGESPKKVGVDYILNAVRLIRPYFASIGIEVQPLKTCEYQQLMQAGADSLTLYQETYEPAIYKKHHLFGLKKNYTNRLNAIEEGAKANFYRLNLGTLLGLYDWRYEALALAQHLNYLMQQYWTIKYSISFPRIKEMYGQYSVDYPTSDKHLVQLITAFRCIYPDLGITLSTREPASLRDNLAPLGITTMSAESNTAPGGYSEHDSEEQFSTSDKRSKENIEVMLKKQKLEAVYKDWDPAF